MKFYLTILGSIIKAADKQKFLEGMDGEEKDLVTPISEELLAKGPVIIEDEDNGARAEKTAGGYKVITYDAERRDTLEEEMYKAGIKPLVDFDSFEQMVRELPDDCASR